MNALNRLIKYTAASIPVECAPLLMFWFLFFAWVVAAGITKT